MRERYMAMCINCGHKWLTKFTPENLPSYQQCPNCWAYTVVLAKQWKEHLQHLRGFISPEEAEKFLKLYDFAKKNGYMNNTKSRDAKFQRLLKDLSESYNRKSLGDDK